MGIAHSVFIALAGALPLFTISPAAPAANYFVSPTGADTNPGTLQQPFATLQRAQQAARQAKGREAVTVSLREGTYYLPETLTFTAEDSGVQEAPRVYQAYQKEQVVISGGARLKAAKWAPHRDGIMKAQVPAGLATDQLFVNGQRQPMARYPNFNPNERIYNGYAADAISPQRAKRWADPRGGFIHAMHEAMWGGFHYVITGKDEKGNVTYEGGWQNNRPAKMHGQYRFVENIFEELDAPGEWYLDVKTATLYFYPPAGVDLSTAVVEAVRLRHLVEFRGTPQAPVGFITLKGLTFRHAARTFMDNKEPLVRSDWTTYRGGAIFYTGAEDCSLEDCFIDQVGGNAVFVNNYNRRLTVRGCHIAKAGGNGVAFVGDREAARVPRDWKDRSQTFAALDRTPGPKTDNYPSDCLVDDCLIYLSGRVEKQTAPVQIELAQGITVRHCSIYDVPRAGINIGDGCWGGHVIEFCDIFDTVKETGDHGSFNSWGRDRYWGLSGLNLNDDKTWETEKAVVRLDAVKTVILRNNRWRCDHGWDIDLDDGSTDYHLSNNLCLNGGIKNREGFFRVVENNIMVGSGFHPHVWFKHSEDVVRRNIMWTDHYLPAGGMPSTPWGGEMDRNLVHCEGMTEPKPAAKLAEQSKRDAHSIIADAMFVDPANGDFRVKEGSPALKLGFVNFPMDRFGVEKPELKAIARTPPMPKLTPPAGDGSVKPVVSRPNYIWQARVRSISGLGDRSAYGLPGEYGVLVLNVPAGSLAAKAGLQKDDVVLACGGKPVRTMSDLFQMQDEAAGKKLAIEVRRRQATLAVDVADYAFVVTEYQASPDFKVIPLAPPSAVLPAKIVAGEPGTQNEPISVLTDGKLARNYGPAFGNGVAGGAYKLDLGAAQSIAQVNTFSYNQGAVRGRQRFVLYGSNTASDPGWNVEDPAVFTPIIDLDTRKTPTTDFVATSIRRSDGKPLGSYRWMVWGLSPVTPVGGGENTAFQELQVISATPSSKADGQVLDAATCRDKALAAEKAQDWPGALEAWERVIDRCAATEAQRVEARTHLKELRPKVPRNTDPQKARPWKVLVVIFRHLDFSWKDGEKTVEVHKTISPDDEKKIRKSVEDFGKHVFHHSSGMLRIDADFAVVDKPLTKMEGTGKGPFCPAPDLIRPFTDPLLKGKQYDTVFSYVKFNEDKGPDVPAPWIAATYASLGEMGGAGYVDVAWHTNYPFPGEASGEMELHEWLHQIDWMFHNVLHYPDDVVPSSDAGRFEGENRPGGDPEYGRTPTETTWMRFYKHIMEDHITRQMWSEAAMHVPPGKH